MVKPLLLILINATLATAAAVSVSDLKQDGIKLIGPSDPQFNAFLTRFGLKSNSVLDTFRPFAVIVQNTGSRGVAAYTIRWTLLQPSGPVENFDFTYSIATAMTFPRRDPNGKPAKAAISPNELRLITPVFSLAASGPAPPPAALPGWSPIIRKCTAASSMSIAVDTIVFDDGTSVGANATHTSERFQAQLSAEHDLKLNIHRQRARIVNPSEIFDYLGQISSTVSPPSAASATSADWYRYYTHLAAQNILRIRDAAGNDAALGAVYADFYSVRPLLTNKGAQ
jgi:hypothetical protein